VRQFDKAASTDVYVIHVDSGRASLQSMSSGYIYNCC
jgi:hypothetical protein